MNVTLGPCSNRKNEYVRKLKEEELSNETVRVMTRRKRTDFNYQ